MKYITLFFQNWYIFLVLLLIFLVIITAVARFCRMSSAAQREKVKEWLLLAVTEAEKELGGGTGQLKLRYVYDLFLQRFPEIAKMISFDTFRYWVDSALIEMREMLQKNKAVSELVRGEEKC